MCPESEDWAEESASKQQVEALCVDFIPHTETSLFPTFLGISCTMKVGRNLATSTT